MGQKQKEKSMCCDNCQLEAINPELYKLKTQWLGHAQAEEFHQKNKNGNGYMFGYHKKARLELEEKIQKYRKTS